MNLSRSFYMIRAFFMLIAAILFIAPVTAFSPVHAKQFDSASPKLGSSSNTKSRGENSESDAMKREAPETRPGILKTVTQGDAIPVRLLNPNEAQEIVQEGNMEIFRHAGRKTVTSVGILCPGHRDYVKSTAHLLQEDRNWMKVKPEGILSDVKDGNMVPVKLLKQESALVLMQTGDVPILTSAHPDSNIQNSAVVILCPGPSDYVKKSISLLSDHQNWTKGE